MTLHLPKGDLEVTFVKNTTQKGQRILRAYEYAKHDDICKAYKKPSGHKVDAFNDIKKEMERLGGSNMRITGAGCDFFSCAYKVRDGAIINDGHGFDYIIYHTPSYRYCVEVPVE